MKRFHWPLQRLLTVTAQRERALKAEMLDLSRRMAIARQAIVHRQMVIRVSLGRLGAAPLAERMRDQEMIMSCSALHQRQIVRQQETLKTLEAGRRSASAEFVKARTKRQTLERMRAEARRQHIRQEMAIEQKQFDETAQMSFRRKAPRRRAHRDVAGG
ncbi:MAG: flagellar FliJ family protein [Planctomycetota bacterium]